MFFDEHARFLDTSQTANQLSRLNWRHRAIIEDNADLLDGSRVLDIASHDGRWSFAALHAGADHVIGIEGRPELVAHANETMALYEVPEGKYRFVAADVLDALAGDHGIRVDVVLCLGFLYHTLRYPEVFNGIRSTGARHLIIDTAVASHQDRVVRLLAEDVNRESAAIDSPQSHQGRVLTGKPSAAALDYMLTTFGFEVIKRFDWPGTLPEDVRAVGVYRERKRVTWVARSTS